METLSLVKSHGGVQGVYSHASKATNCDMTFAVYMPPQTTWGQVPVLWYLSGLTCTHANVVEKGEFRAAAAARGVAIVCPDTSPRGAHVPDEPGNWQLGSGAGFYLDATEPPFHSHYNMASYVVDELPALLAQNFNIDPARQGIFGHSMGGHGALTLALKNPGRYAGCSAFAPIVSPSTSDWSTPAFERYLGSDPANWRAYDACNLIEDGHRIDALLVDQGEADGFLNDGLKPWLLDAACQAAGIDLTLRMRPGYDHSYFFISTFMADHINWHADQFY